MAAGGGTVLRVAGVQDAWWEVLPEQARQLPADPGLIDAFLDDERFQTATFWVYSPADREATLKVDTLGTADARLSVNGHDVLRLTKSKRSMAVSLSGGINKVTLTGGSSTTLVDRLTVTPTEGTLETRTYEADDAKLAGSATPTSLSLATAGTAITGIGGAPGNGDTATFTVTADRTGLYTLRIRYSNPEQAEATHYNPDPLARHADITVNAARCGVPLRSRYAPLIDRITVAPYAREAR